MKANSVNVLNPFVGVLACLPVESRGKYCERKYCESHVSDGTF